MHDAPDALREVEQACAELLEHWAGALTLRSTEADADARAMSDGGLVRVVESLGLLARRVEALQARCAAEVAGRSRGVDPEADLARQRGFASPERLLCDAFGGRYADAARLVAVRDATSKRSSSSGEPLPAKHPHLAAALPSGAIGVDAAELIRRFLERVAIRAERDAVEAAEQLLVERAPAVGVDGIPRLTKQLEAIETLVGAELHRARDAKRAFGEVNGPGGSSGSPVDPATAEDRSIAQLNADALADIARLSLTSADAPPRAPRGRRGDPHRSRRARERLRSRHDRRYRPTRLRGDGTRAGGIRRRDPPRPRRQGRSPRPRPRRPALHTRAEARPRRTRWRLCLARMPPSAVARTGPPHQVVEPRPRPDRPCQRRDALQSPSPSSARRRLARLDSRPSHMVHASGPSRSRAAPASGQQPPATSRRAPSGLRPAPLGGHLPDLAAARSRSPPDPPAARPRSSPTSQRPDPDTPCPRSRARQPASCSRKAGGPPGTARADAAAATKPSGRTR